MLISWAQVVFMSARFGLMLKWLLLSGWDPLFVVLRKHYFLDRSGHFAPKIWVHTLAIRVKNESLCCCVLQISSIKHVIPHLWDSSRGAVCASVIKRAAVPVQVCVTGHFFACSASAGLRRVNPDHGRDRRRDGCAADGDDNGVRGHDHR